MATRKPTKPRTRSRSSKPGQPTKCTPETAERVRKAILKGAGREDAARAAGVGPSTMREWLAKGLTGEEPYAAFLAVVEGAESELVRKAGQVVTDLLGSKKTPHAVRFAAAKLVLERRRADVWAPRGTLKHEGPDGGPVRVAAQVEHSGEVQLAPLVTRETLRELTRAETEAALALEFERQQANNRDEEGVES
jgi:hypothetical protein